MSKQKFFLLLLSVDLFFFTGIEGVLNPKSAFSYTLSGGRFGDNLLSVAHAAWLSYSLGLPLVYRSFPYSEQLYLSIDPEVCHLKESAFSKFYSLDGPPSYMKLWEQILSRKTEESTLIQVPYYPESLYEYETYAFAPYNQINWDEPGFLNLLRRLISPIDVMPDPQLPKDRISVAIHIRTGGNADSKYLQRFYPMKSPSRGYYKDALRIVLDIVKRPLYVFIFTDDVNPPEVLKDLSESFLRDDILFDCRWEGNQHNKNVLEDFFMLEKYDCLIRSDSNFSLMASKLFSYKVALSPFHVQMKSGRSKVDQFLVHIQMDKGVSPLRTIIYK